MFNKTIFVISRLAGWLTLFLIINGCEEFSLWPWQQTSSIRVTIIQKGRTSLRLEESLNLGLIQKFAKDYQLKISWQWYKNEDDAARALIQNKADVVSHRLISNTHAAFNPAQPDLQKNFLTWLKPVRRKNFAAPTDSQHYLDTSDVLHFLTVTQKQNNLLPIFKAAASEYNLPWPLVAAIAFQESHWDQNAVSYTGVRGIMMLTKDTAKHLGVKNRNDTHESIWGGAKYINQLILRQPKNLSRRAQLALALAAYNIGPKHLHRAFRLAKNQGKSPHQWNELKSTLPALTRARGRESIQFVDRVLSYYDLISATM